MSSPPRRRYGDCGDARQSRGFPSVSQPMVARCPAYAQGVDGGTVPRRIEARFAHLCPGGLPEAPRCPQTTVANGGLHVRCRLLRASQSGLLLGAQGGPGRRSAHGVGRLARPPKLAPRRSSKRAGSSARGSSPLPRGARRLPRLDDACPCRPCTAASPGSQGGLVPARGACSRYGSRGRRRSALVATRQDAHKGQA